MSTRQRLIDWIKIKHKTGIGLIVFSVTIVVCALMLLFGINEAGKREITKLIKEKGNVEQIEFSPEIFTKKGYDALSEMMSFSDFQLIKNRCPQVKSIGFFSVIDIEEGRIEKRGCCWAKATPEKSAPGGYPPQIYGTSPESKKGLNVKIKEGRFINDMDMRYKRKVCVLGAVAYELLGKGKVIGKKLITKNPDEKFTIIGILEKKMPLFTALPLKIQGDLVTVEIDSNMSSPKMPSGKILAKMGRRHDATNLNLGIYIPISTWKDFFKEVKEEDFPFKSIGGLVIPDKTLVAEHSSIPSRTFVFLTINTPPERKENKEKLFIDKELQQVFKEFYEPLPERLKNPINDIYHVLRKKYGNDKFFDFFLGSGKLVDELNDQIEDSNKLLGITGGVTLLLSIIILSSTMLMSVHNRVTEIGVRRAFGARKKDIFYQFLTEGAAIYLIGIVIGLVFGVVLSYLLIVKILSWEYSTPVYNIILSSVIPFLVGILSSLYPAMKAANIQPAVAVKCE